MHNNKLTVKLHNGIKLSTTKRQQMQQAIFNVIADIDKTSIIVSVTFNKSLGNIRAYQARDGMTIASDSLTGVGAGIIVLADRKDGDTIGIDGETEGTAQVVINAQTDAPTPRSYKAGPFSELFIVTT